jgi:(+)-neomenthol dehydrogenase
MTTAKKIALVTGGNKGIGLEMVRNLAGAGCTVLLGARNPERGQEAVRQLKRAGLDDVHFLEIDVTRQETVIRRSAAFRPRWGPHEIQSHSRIVFTLEAQVNWLRR